MLALSLWIWPSVALAQAPVHWAVFVDDLHLDFRSTGTLRDFLRAVARDLVRDGDAVSVASSGPSSLSVRDAVGGRALTDVVRFVVGNGLKDADMIERQPRRVDEVAYRSRTALDLALAFVTAVGPRPADRGVLLFVSRGHPAGPLGSDRSLDVDIGLRLDEVAKAAADAGFVTIAIEPPGADISDPPITSLVSPEALQRHLDARLASRRRLVGASGGFVDQDSRDRRGELFSRINALVGR